MKRKGLWASDRNVLRRANGAIPRWIMGAGIASGVAVLLLVLSSAIPGVLSSNAVNGNRQPTFGGNPSGKLPTYASPAVSSKGPQSTTTPPSPAGCAVSLPKNCLWGGFATVPSGGQIDEVFSEWNVPTASCPSTLSSASLQLTWVGIDGYNTGTVEQVGTYAYCSGASATPSYYSWWEFYPYNNVQAVSSVNAGDLIQAYVLYNPTACINSVCGIYTLQLTDLNSVSSSFSVTGDPSNCHTGVTGTTACEGGTDSTAECISEAPSGYLLTNYGSQSFYNCMVSIGGKFQGIGKFSPVYKPTTYGASSGTLIQSVSTLTNGYSSTYWAKSVFTVTWKGYN